jgi:membrane dipeptidase
VNTPARALVRTAVGLAVLISLDTTQTAAQTSSNAIMNAPVQVTARAQRLHRNALVIDGHNDFPWELREQAEGSLDRFDISKPATNFQTDIPRLRAGGVGAQFWVAYVPPETMRTGEAARQTLEQIDVIHRMVRRYPDTFAMALTADDILRVRKSGKIACLIGIEGGHCIENSLATLRMYHALGARYMTLTHADSVGWADAATDAPQCNGLSDFGRQVIAEMNRLGMLVDISHVSVATMNAALDVSTAPIIASHSSAYAIAQHPRNIPDDVLKRMKQNGGVVMVNFFSGFVVPESAKVMLNMFDVSREMRKKFPAREDYEKAKAEWTKAHPMPAGTVKDLVNHIDHIVKVAGIDHVGLGSDYDGANILPEQLKDVSSYPVITQEMLNRGYSESDIKKVLGQNILRVLRAAERK